MSVKICDFGLSDFVNKQNPLLKVCGKPGYLAPECLQLADLSKCENVRLSTKGDSLSVGVLLYFLLTGDIPFTGESVDQVVCATLAGSVNYSLSKLTSAPSNILNLLKGLLTYNAYKRLSAGEALNHPSFELDVKDVIQQSPKADSTKSVLKRAIKLKLIPQAKVNSSSIQKERKNSNFGNITLCPKITDLSKSISKQQICIKVNTDLELISNRTRKSSKIQLRQQSTTEQVESNSPKKIIITRNASIHKSDKHGMSLSAA